MTDKYIFEWHDRVRDYECDIQGIVNNSNYMHYMEHARHMFLLSRGVSFSGLHEKGCDVVVARVEVQYKCSLRPNDEYITKLYVTKEGPRYIFHHAIFRKSDMKLCIRAHYVLAALVNGKLATSYPELDELLQ
ncbi:MAG: acyl-CoA thioesterase [Paludibacteraceae bacterium]|nr:acyl-CoA thioesterase [Paludibacteraceae bacterium]